MRVAVDLPEDHLAELKKIASARKTSLAVVIREAIESFVDGDKEKSKAMDDAFGIWSDREIDGLEYQRKLRDEW